MDNKKAFKPPFWYKNVYVVYNTIRELYEFRDWDHNPHTAKTINESKQKIDSFTGSKPTKRDQLSF